MDFAKKLFKEGEYYRAVTEFKRFIYLHPAESAADEARVFIAKSYFKGGEHEECAHYIEKHRGELASREWLMEADILLGDCYAKMESYLMAAQVYDQVMNEYPKASARIHLRIARLNILQGKWRKAAKAFGRVRGDKEKTNLAREAAKKILDGEKIERKSPAAAGVLAALLPGAGHIYTGRRQDGIVSFVLNGAFIWGIIEAFNNDSPLAGGILAFFELGWYGGNIHSAMNGAHRYNEKKETEFRKSMEDNFGLILKNTGSGKKEGFISWNVRF